MLRLIQALGILNNGLNSLFWRLVMLVTTRYSNIVELAQSCCSRNQRRDLLSLEDLTPKSTEQM